jgi:hypothetical protein
LRKKGGAREREREREEEEEEEGNDFISPIKTVSINWL